MASGHSGWSWTEYGDGPPQIISNSQLADSLPIVEPATLDPASCDDQAPAPLRTEVEAWELVLSALPFIQNLIERLLLLRGLKSDAKHNNPISRNTERYGSPADHSKPERQWHRAELATINNLSNKTDTFTHVRDEEIQKAIELAFELARDKYDPRVSKFETFIEAHIKASMKLKAIDDRTEPLDRFGKYAWSEDGEAVYYTQDVKDSQPSVPGVDEPVIFGGAERITNTSATLGRHPLKKKRGGTFYYTAVEEDPSNNPEEALFNGQWLEGRGGKPEFVCIEKPEPPIRHRLPATLDEAIAMLPDGYMHAILQMRFKGMSYKQIANRTGRDEFVLERDVSGIEQALREHYPVSENVFNELRS